MPDLALIAHNLRSTHNVGSLLRTADGLGVKKVYLTGYTPYPSREDDDRLPHLAAKIDKQISKTALGAEASQAWNRVETIESAIAELRQSGFQIVALEQTPNSQPLPDFKPGPKVALVVGREVEGIEPEILDLCDVAVEIPMFGSKESFNVSVAAAIALAYCRFQA
ncbi:MAG TPA: RNA methyltransferase [Candidatus Saccharimonadales bacterium]|nr:RNA methyltransferase [Candidatus Saccharimonadales bacterium]